MLVKSLHSIAKAALAIVTSDQKRQYPMRVKVYSSAGMAANIICLQTVYPLGKHLKTL